ncbi:MAG: type restriction protein res subunit [Ignavibacteria bacterium]|nr:type restriction protein res subunit [Ignavibacteria bacterium]
MQNPEQEARQNIDIQLTQCCWIIQDYKQVNLSVGPGIAVREFPTDSGEADYMLFIEGKPIGVIEAKPEGTILTTVHDQSFRYATDKIKWFINSEPLPFVYESTGIEIHFADYRDPKPRSREIFSFHKPETLKEWLKNANSLRYRLQHIPTLELNNLRDCQFNAINKLDKSFSDAKPKALIQMATGSGKTFTAITSIYRLLKFAGAKRILFLVDTRNLGEQAQQEFQAFTPPDDNRKFTELYNVQRLNSNFIDKNSQVCISTIQRMYSILSNEELDESAEQTSLNELHLKDEKPKEVYYNQIIPIEFFDFIIVDECHRSIYNLWKQVLDYFDSFLIGLTATPDARTYAFFNENIVSEYSHESAVADGVNVGYDVYTIETEITTKGGKILKDYVETRSKLDRKKRWTQLDEDIEYKPTQLDRDIVNKSQIRKVIRTFKESLQTEIFPNRKEVPKTLIFAKTDSHADDIISIVLEEFGEENKFCKKITYNAENPSSILQSFRNSYYPRIAVTVDMIATGTDVKPIECLLFMRDVKSKNYFEQMKGRGTRTLDMDSLKTVTPSATTNKTHFVIVDAVGVCKSIKTDSRPLERKKSVPLKELLIGVALGQHDEDTITSLANRLTRIDRQITDEERSKINELADGKKMNQIIHDLLNSYDPDKQFEKAKELFKITENKESNHEQIEIAKRDLIKTACMPFNKPELRDYFETCRQTHEQIIDNQNIDKLIFAGYDEQAKDKAQQTIESFKKFIAENKDEMIALRIFYDQPYRRRELTFKMIKELYEAIQRPPLLLTIDKLWFAYEHLNGAIVKGKSIKRTLTDIISILRFELGFDTELYPYNDIVNRNFKDWIFRKNAGNMQFTEEQTEWLRMIKDHIISSVNIEKSDFDNTPFAEHGGLMKVWKLFGNDLDNLIEEMNVELVA